jgi:hypothetical protein
MVIVSDNDINHDTDKDVVCRRQRQPGRQYYDDDQDKSNKGGECGVGWGRRRRSYVTAPLTIVTHADEKTRQVVFYPLSHSPQLFCEQLPRQRLARIPKSKNWQLAISRSPTVDQ